LILLEVYRDLVRRVANYRKRRIRAEQDRRILQCLSRKGVTTSLHLGCGGNEIPGWLNTDLYPTSPSILSLDATKPFPFANDTFDYVFSEHMIEHIPYPAGCFMLRECFRVMKPGGTIRISTPDLRFVVDLYNCPHDDYIRWATEQLIPWAPVADRAFVVNNFFRDWGHQFIFDDRTLSASLRETGFINIARRELKESNVEALRGLENETRMPSGFLSLETLTLEANKPQTQLQLAPVSNQQITAAERCAWE
jgi:predicted SAM-dependent methyltransferase